MYDYGFRFYDPAIARFHAIDPLSESHFDITPYHYTLNNPVRYIDILGLDTADVNNQSIWDASALWFNVSVDWSWWGAGVGGQLGPLKGEAEASVLNAEGKVEKKGDDVTVEGKGTVGNVKLSGGVNNVAEGTASGSLAEGTVTVNSDGVNANGKLVTGSIEGSNSTTQSSYKKSGSVVPRESKTEQKNLPVGSDVNNFNLELSGKAGPVKVSVGGNPAVGAAKGVMVMDSYAKQATGQAPPMPMFIIFKALFGGGGD